jgi:hypothetical protein
MSTNTNGPAFPQVMQWHNGNLSAENNGMTLRDYFAAKAMQAQVGNPLKLGDDEAHRLIAERAYRMADAMLKARDA